jgi:hypothetical protein
LKRLLFIASIALFYSACDNPILNESDGTLTVQSFQLSPSSFQFSESDGIRDTTVTVTFTVQIDGEPDSTKTGFSLSLGNETIASGPLTQTQTPGVYTAQTELTFSTLSFSTFRAYVYAYDQRNYGNSIERKLKVQGILTAPPEIIEVNNPEEVQIPASGQTQITFTARVVHPFAQELIQRVAFFIVDSQNRRLPDSNSSFEMFDDGVTNLSEGRNDEAANDSVYTRVLFANENNTPENYRIFYFALDKAGQSSDTLETILRFVE